MYCLDLQDTFTIQRLTVSDDLLVGCAAKIYSEEIGDYHPKKNLIQRISDQQAFLLLALGKNQEPLGAVTGWILQDEDTIKEKFNLKSAEVSVGYIQSLAVSNSYQKRGLGRALVKNILQCFSSLGCEQAITVAWERSFTFFNKQGFRLQKEIPYYWKSESLNTPDFCVKCGSPCECDAFLMSTKLEPTIYENLAIANTNAKL